MSVSDDLIAGEPRDGGLARTNASFSRHLGSQTMVVIAGNVFTLAVGLPLQIYVSKVLGASGVGVFGLLSAVVATATSFLGLGIAQTTVRFIPMHLERGEYGEARALVRQGALLLLAVGALCYLAVLAALPWIGRWWPAISDYRLETAMMGLMIPLGLLTYYFQQALRGLHEIRYAVLGTSVLQLSVKTVMTVAVFSVGYQLRGYVFATVFGALCATLWMLWGLAKKLRQLGPAPPIKGVLAEWRRYAGVTYSGTLVTALGQGLDRYLLGIFGGASPVGILVVVGQLQQLPATFNAMLLMAGSPMLAAAHGRDDRAARQHIFVLMTDWVVRLSLPLVLFLLLFAHPVLSLYGQRFADDGVRPLQVLVLAQFFGLLCGPVGNVALMSGLERAAIRISIASAMLSTVLLVALIPFFGLMGAAVALSAGTVVTNLANLVLVRGRLQLVWLDVRYRAWIGEIAAALAVAFSFLHFSPGLGAVALASAMMLMYLAALAATLLSGLHEDDREVIRFIWERVRGRSGAA